jgi:hypothetical protein
VEAVFQILDDDDDDDDDICYFLYALCLHLHTRNKPCFQGIQCCSYSVVTIYVTCDVICNNFSACL